MSYRINLDDDKQEWADYNLCDYNSLRELTNSCYWQLPVKLRGSDNRKILEFLILMDEEHAMTPENFWWIHYLKKKNPVEHPSWEELYEYLDITWAARSNPSQ